MLALLLIRNEKPVGQATPDAPRVYQLETAIGAAIALFAGAQALCTLRTKVGAEAGSYRALAVSSTSPR